MINNFVGRLFVLLLMAITISGCQTILRTVIGMRSKVEFIVENQERLKHYQPFMEVDNINIYTFKNPTEFCKYINFFLSQISTVYFEDIENNKYYKITCLDDLKDIIEDFNNGDMSYLDTVSAEEFLAIKNYITQTSERMYHQENQNQPKKWNIYLSSGTLVGGMMKKHFLAITHIKELNHLYILDLSVDDANKTITEQDFQIIECEEFIKKKK